MTATTTTTPRTQTGVLVEQVVRRFGDRVVLDHLDLTIDDDELVVLLGPSGCGKSTLQLGPRARAARAEERGPDPQGRRAGLPQPGGGRLCVQLRQGGRLVDLEPAVGDRGQGRCPDHRQGRSADRPGQQLLRGNRQVAQRPEPPGRLADLLTRVARIFNWAQQNPDQYAKAIAKETGVSLEDARTTVDAYPFKITQVLPEDVKAQQALSDAFFEAGEINKKVDITTITDNLLPDGFDSSKQLMSAARRELHLNAFLMEAGHHEAAWRLPESNPRADFDLAHWIELAQLAENAKFDSLFLADGPALTGSGEFRPPGQLEPLTLLTALSQHTSRIGLIATVSSTYNEPYNLARRLASVDHVSGGRAGWNIVTSATPEEAANFGLDNRLDHSSRYARADEFLDVAKALWDSWETDAVLGDKSSGRYSDLSRLHTIDHHGDHFKVAGPLNVERPPQGHPLLVQAGSSEDGKSFAARHAEAIFTAHQTYERAADFYGDIKARTKAAGRDPDGVLVLPGIVPIIGSTEREARELARQLDELRVPEYGLWQLANILETDTSAFELDKPLPDFVLARPKLEGAQSRADLIIELAQRESLTVREILSRLGGGRGHFTFIGTPDQVVDTIVAWFEGGAADGFNIMAAALPSGLETFIDHVLPILRRKGLFREDYTGSDAA